MPLYDFDEEMTKPLINSVREFLDEIRKNITLPWISEMSAIIKVENLSKRFIISHEERESYTSLRDVITGNIKKHFRQKREPLTHLQRKSFGRWKTSTLKLNKVTGLVLLDETVPAKAYC